MRVSLSALCGVAVPLLAVACGARCRAATQDRPRPPSVQVVMVTDEADAVLAILTGRRRGEPLAQSEWDHLFSSDGYRRLARRELSFHLPFSEPAFRAFVLSDSLAARAPALAATLRDWREADVGGSAERALRYLPGGTPLRATMYLVIKPKGNSFVFFEDSLAPAIFLYVNPRIRRAELENTMSHELHHIGVQAACTSITDTTLPERVRTTLMWMSALGEGRAMLAAAGDPSVHPQRASPDSDRVRWDRDLAGCGKRCDL